MNLTRTDYFALSGLLVASVGLVAIIVSLSVGGSEARMLSEIKLSKQEVNQGLANIRSDFGTLSDDVVGIVEQGLKARSDEVVLAMTSLADFGDQLTVHVSNMKETGALYQKFNDVRASLGSDANIYAINGRVHATVYLEDFGSEKAHVLQSIFSETSEIDREEVVVRFTLDGSKVRPTNAVNRQLIERQIQKYQTILEAVDD